MQTGRYILTIALVFGVGTLTTSPGAHANEAAKSDRTATTEQRKAGDKQVSTQGVEKSSANMVLVGELLDSRDVTLKGVNEEKHRLLKVKPGDGDQTVIVDIGKQDAAASFGLVKGDRLIAVGKSARINDRPVLFARSIGELYPVGRVGSVARDREQMMQDNSARGATPATPSTSGDSSTGGKNTKPSTSTSSTTTQGAASVDVPDARKVDEVVVFFDTNNLGTDQYGTFDRDFVWVTVDPAYATWNTPANAMAWNDNWETPHWDVWGYDDADEWGLFDW